MRRLLLVALLALPASLVAQFPKAGHYKAVATPAGQDQEIPLDFTVSMVGDSTALDLAQGEQHVPLTDQGLVDGGFFLTFGTTRCPFVMVEDRWEAVCANEWNEPQFVVTFPRQPEPQPKP